MNINTVIICLIFSFSCFSQEIRINGRTITKEGQALPFVIIKNRNLSVGTISNSKGNFDLNIPTTLKNDTLEFYILGSKKILVPISKILQDKNTVVLEEDITKLEEVTVKSTKTKHVVFGNIAKRYRYRVYESTVTGAELGVKIKIKQPTYINSITMFIGENDCDTVFLRFNMYDYQDHKIGERLGKSDQILTVPQLVENKRVVRLICNFTGLLLKNDALFSFQYIDTKGCKSDKGLVMLAIPMAKTYFKKNLVSNWKIESLFGPAIIIDGDEIVD